MNEKYSQFRSSILNEHNRLRCDPISYIPFIEEYIKCINKDNLLILPHQAPIKLKEGSQAFVDAIIFLKNQPPVKALTFEDNLSKASQTFSDYLGSKGFNSDLDENGCNISDRIENFIQWEFACGESVEYGSFIARDVIVSLLVDDGGDTNSRSRRRNLFSKEFKFIGIGISDHSIYKTCVVLNYVGGIIPKGETYFDLEELIEQFIYPNKNDNKDCDLNDKDYLKIINSNLKSEKVKIKRELLENGKIRKLTRKYYIMENGMQYFIENEEITN